MKRILGLDLGTNSIGWAVVERDNAQGRIINSGCRIIPMSKDELSNFANGNTKSKTSERTTKRIARRMRERFLLRRERIHRLLHILGFLPQHYEAQIGWDLENDTKHYGNFLEGHEPKIAWKKNENGKYEFLFLGSFMEMLEDFKKIHPNIVSDGKKIPYDWVLYYLRNKALTQKISKEELAWIILNFNQKRGYNQQRDEELEKKEDKKEEYLSLTVSSVTPDDNSTGEYIWYNIRFENSDIVYRRKSKTPLEWVGKYRNLIVTTKLDKDGNPKLKNDGTVDYSVKSPSDEDWALQKLKTEQDIRLSGMTIGEYIYQSLLNNPDEKIRGGLVRTVERNFYKEELEKILKKQKEYHPELNDRILYETCINELYRNNEAHRNNIHNNDFIYLILEDVLFYQRPLKSKKSLIDNCPYERHSVLDKETGEIITFPVKCTPKSNPHYQEYRIWKFLSDLRIIANIKEIDGHIYSDVDVTSEFIPDNESWYNLFEWLNDKGFIDQSELLTHIGIKKKEQSKYRWNFVEDKKYPMNATRHALLRKMQNGEILSREMEQTLWHLLYSTTSKAEIDKSLSQSKTYKRLISSGISEKSIENLKRVKFPDEGYGAYSEKAIKKLLPLMRTGKLWSADMIDGNTLKRINDFIVGKGMEDFSENVVKRLSSLTEIDSYQKLPEWLACYVVYGRHSEASEIVKWKSPSDIDIFLNNFKQHSLRNPIVESIVLECLRVVKDLWVCHGDFDEIHIELGREMKNPSEKRARITQRILENENTNLRIKALLAELVDPEFKVNGVRPHSPSQQDLLRIYEEDVLANNTPDKEIQAIISSLSNPSKQPSKQQIMRYKCWLDQKYCSPYTGQPIPLSQLFTSDYEIEHIIPQSKYFDDSFSNKVICESEVNKLKGNELGYSFIKKCHGQTIQLSRGRMVRILEVTDYENFVKDTYSGHNSSLKRKKLLMDEIPTEFNQRQLNDSRYISKLVKGLLSNIVRGIDEDGNLEREAISKNVITCNGSITTRLKRDWGIGEVWNDVVLPRFKRLNDIDKEEIYTKPNSHGKEIPIMPFKQQKGFNIKRIDHRHHAMDAIVIACTTREHVNLLNNETSMPEHKEMKHSLSRKLRRVEEFINNGKKSYIYKEFLMPWPSFKTDTMESLQQIIVSFKQNNRVLTQATNKYQILENGKKVFYPQHGSDHYSIRKPLHKETVFGHVNLQRKRQVDLKKALVDANKIVDKRLKLKIKELKRDNYTDKQVLLYFKNNAYQWKGYDFNKIDVYYYTDEKEEMVATRFCNDLISIFKDKTNADEIEKIIAKITDTGIQKILTNYLNENIGNIKDAFTADGLDLLNENIKHYNNGKSHKPIYKVRLTETLGEKFQVGHNGNNFSKYVEAAKGTNLFFGVYINEDNKRSFATIPLNIVVERLKQHLSPVPEQNEKGDRLLFYLSPGDLVYVPDSDETENPLPERMNPNRIYKLESCSTYNAFFIPHHIASLINDKEFPKQSQRGWNGEMVKDICLPLKVNRIGNISIR